MIKRHTPAGRRRAVGLSRPAGVLYGYGALFLVRVGELFRPHGQAGGETLRTVWRGKRRPLTPPLAKERAAN